MNSFYLKVNEEDLNKLRGIDNIPHITLPDEMDTIPDEIKQTSKDLENAYQNFVSKEYAEIEKRIKAMMWFHQDYNRKHYHITFYDSNHTTNENGILKFESKNEIEYRPPKRNGHRRNYPPSDLYKDIALEIAQKEASQTISK